MWNKIKQNTGTEMVITFSGIIIFLTGILAFTGWLTDIRVISSFHPKYIPLAPSTALVFIIMGGLLSLNLFNSNNKKVKPYVLAFTILITLSGMLHFLSNIFHIDLTYDQIWNLHNEKIGNIQIYKMSRYTGLLFFISGIALQLKYFGKDHKSTVNIIGNLGMFIAFAGFIASLGYVLGTPFLYSGDFIPLAFSTAISFLFLGLGILALAGENHFFVRKLIGNQASARILRTFIPFLILENVFGDTLEQNIASHYNVNEALISALVSLVTIVIGIVLILYLTKRIFQSADKAETERLIASKALKESLELRSSLLRTIPFGMDIIDENGTILFMNMLMTNNLGKNVIGKKCWEVYKDNKSRCQDCPIAFNLNLGETKTSESDGVLGGRTFEITHTGLIFEGKKAILEIFNDITDRKQSELKLKEYAGELELANNTKDKLFSIIAHDLRSPFNTILGLTNLLNDKYSIYSEEDKKLIVEKLKESSENAFNLLENLLAWSLAQREGIKVTAEKIDLHEIASAQIDVLKNAAILKNIGIDNQISPGTYADADKNMITTVIRNLLNNALKFTHSGGNIILTTLNQNDMVEVSVKDNGVGIETDILKELFKSGDTHTTKGTANEKGTGLGLMVCKEFVETNGGEIWVDSVEGKGSKFSFTLPIQKM
jgi:PAS domain S-box-containing protein